MNVPSRQADHGERHGATVLLRTSRPRQGRALRVGIHDQGPPPPGQSCRQKEARQRLAAAALEVHHRDLHRPPSAGFVLTSVRKFSSVYVCTDIRMYGHTYLSTSVSQYISISVHQYLSTSVSQYISISVHQYLSTQLFPLRVLYGAPAIGFPFYTMLDGCASPALR